MKFLKKEMIKEYQLSIVLATITIMNDQNFGSNQMIGILLGYYIIDNQNKIWTIDNGYR